jgi:hypothetical protein
VRINPRLGQTSAGNMVAQKLHVSFEVSVIMPPSKGVPRTGGLSSIPRVLHCLVTTSRVFEAT